MNLKFPEMPIAVLWGGTTKAGILHNTVSSLGLSMQSATDLRAKLEAAQIRVEHYGSFDSDPAEQLKAIKVHWYVHMWQSCDHT